MQDDGEDAHRLGCWDELGSAERDEVDRFKDEWLAALGGEAESEATTSDLARALDRNAVDDERVFIRRFGFDWPLRDRIGLIKLKHRLDLTDREIRLLKWTGNLKRCHGRVTLASARSAAIFGRCIAVFAFFEFAVILLLEGLATHHGLSALQVAKLYGATAFVLAMLWLVHLGYIKPWIIEQRVMRGAEPSQQ